jgi:hypothetical protein
MVVEAFVDDEKHLYFHVQNNYILLMVVQNLADYKVEDQTHMLRVLMEVVDKMNNNADLDLDNYKQDIPKMDVI